jgi:hypothetical protein
MLDLWKWAKNAFPKETNSVTRLLRIAWKAAPRVTLLLGAVLTIPVLVGGLFLGRQLAATNIYNNIPVTPSKDVATITNLQTEIGAKDGTINKLQDEIRNRDATISELKDQNQLMMYWRREFFTMSGKLGKVEKELSDKRSDEALRQALPQMGSFANVRSKDVRTEHNISDCNNPNDKAFRNFESQGIVTAYNYHHC